MSDLNIGNNTGVGATTTTAVVPVTTAVAGTVTTAGAGAVTMARATGAGSVNTTGSGAVNTAGSGAINTAGSGAVHATGITGGWILNTTGAGSVTSGGGSGIVDTTGVPWKVAVLDFLAEYTVNKLGIGDKLAFLLVTGAVEMHARGATVRKTLYAALVTLVVGIALHYGSTCILKK